MGKENRDAKFLTCQKYQSSIIYYLFSYQHHYYCYYYRFTCATGYKETKRNYVFGSNLFKCKLLL